MTGGRDIKLSFKGRARFWQGEEEGMTTLLNEPLGVGRGTSHYWPTVTIIGLECHKSR